MEDQPPGELDLLHRYLSAQRAHVLGAIEGLDDDDLARPVLPSGWTCLSLLHHLTMNELLWFGCVLGGDPASIEKTLTGTDWVVPEGSTAADVVAAYRAEIERSDEVISGARVDQPFAWWPDFFGEWRLESVSALMLHVITEVACHAGHLDAVCELLDGRQFLTLD